jgi:hypothetical protein
MIEQGYSRCHSDHCVYFKRLENGSYIILLLYVDDMLVAGSNMQGYKYAQEEISQFICDEGFGCCKENPWHENNKREKIAN